MKKIIELLGQDFWDFTKTLSPLEWMAIATLAAVIFGFCMLVGLIISFLVFIW